MESCIRGVTWGDVERLEGAPTPLLLREDWEQVVESVPAEAPEDPVDVSSGDSSEEKEEGEREKGLTSRRLRESRGLPPPSVQVPCSPPSSE